MRPLPLALPLCIAFALYCGTQVAGTGSETDTGSSAQVTGIVTRANGATVAGGMVVLREASGGTPAHTLTSPRQALTTTLGSFCFDSVDPGRYYVESRDGDSLGALGTLNVPDADTVIRADLVVGPLGAISGALDPSLTPAPSGLVLYIVELDRAVMADSVGTFTFLALPQATYTIRVFRYDSLLATPLDSVGVAVAGDTIRIDRLGAISCRVLLHATPLDDTMFAHVVDSARLTVVAAGATNSYAVRVGSGGVVDTLDLRATPASRLLLECYGDSGAVLYAGEDTLDLIPGRVFAYEMVVRRVSGIVDIVGTVADSLPPGTLFYDDFADGALDPTLWLASTDHGTGDIPLERGDSIAERGGVLRLVQGRTDFGGRVFSAPITVDPLRDVVIECSTRVHYASDKMRGWMRLIEVDSTGAYLVRELCNIHHSNYVYNTTTYVGFGRNGTALMPPLWDTWFFERIVYSPASGQVSYTANGTTIIWTESAMSAVTGARMRLDMSSYGWNTGHWTEYESVLLTQ